MVNLQVLLKFNLLFCKYLQDFQQNTQLISLPEAVVSYLASPMSWYPTRKCTNNTLHTI